MAHNSTSYTSGEPAEDTSLTFPNDTFIFENETDSSDAAAYSFSSKLCPFGFEPLLLSNKSSKDTSIGGTAVDQDTGLPDLTNLTTRSLTNISAVDKKVKAVKCQAPGESMRKTYKGIRKNVNYKQGLLYPSLNSYLKQREICELVLYP